jgi:ADP-heptose:LPS heptosyltransferase
MMNRPHSALMARWGLLADQSFWSRCSAAGFVALRRVLSLIFHALIALAGCIFFLVYSRFRGRSNVVLLVRTDALGDTVLFVPVLASLRSHFRDSRVVLVVRDSQMEMMNDCPYVDEVIGVDDRRFRRSVPYAVKTICRIARKRPSLAINGAYSRSFLSDEITVWSCSSRVVGWTGEWQDSLPVFKPFYDLFYSERLENEILPDVHELDRHAILLRALGVQDPNLLPMFWDKLSAPSERRRSRAEVKASGPSVVLVTGANNSIREWPFDSYVEIARRLKHHVPNVSILLVGSEGEKSRRPLGSPEMDCIVDLRGLTSLGGLIAIIRDSILVVGNETGPMHLAIAIGTPTVAIVGGGHFGRFMPYGDSHRHRFAVNRLECYSCSWNCSRVRPECIEGVRVDDVWQQILDIL